MDNKYQIGQLVECFWPQDKEFYNATVSKINDDGSYQVAFVDDEYKRLKVPESQIRAYQTPDEPSIEPPTAPLTSDKSRLRAEVEIAFGKKRSAEPKRRSSSNIDAGSYLSFFPGQMLVRQDCDKLYCNCCNKTITGIKSTIQIHIKSKSHNENLLKVFNLFGI